MTIALINELKLSEEDRGNLFDEENIELDEQSLQQLQKDFFQSLARVNHIQEVGNLFNKDKAAEEKKQDDKSSDEDEATPTKADVLCLSI